MTDVTMLKMPDTGEESIAFIDGEGAVWVVFYPSWWDIASLLWWALTPSDRKAWIQVRKNGLVVRARAVRVARAHAKIGKRPT